ncbi:DUF2997 domain-containing protein [Pseudoramibacter sp.]|jgi:hypothetical protein|uniref:DUF2997 domain-containing protein n=1 Tax=Pseudoramibacter sp. TaxID=2034862 RepID=UPI0025EADC71|nr:DUF2997 domain-containing protein [Pseudoramibacter sp.]MCH4072049.1 DUF2997 domain-containing protein [Pseudoramibacter sp.]MCH4105818.1 DUF2997 domain-containing protein [Pseudoramibacter sp.]
MKKQIQVRIFPDGKIKAETQNMKGSACLKYIKPLEEMLQAKTVDSHFTDEYYETESQIEENNQEKETIRNEQ